MRSPEAPKGEFSFIGKSDLTSGKRDRDIDISSVKKGINRVGTELRDCHLWLFYGHLCLPYCAMGFMIASSQSLGWPVRRIRAETMLRLFGERGREWLERTGKDKYLTETTGRQHYKEDGELFRAVDIFTAPVSAELKDREKDLRSILFLQGSSRSTPVLPPGKKEIVSFPQSLQRRDSDLTLSLSAQEELAKRMESASVVFKEFTDLERRSAREKSDALRATAINGLRRIYNLRRYLPDLPALDGERSFTVYLLTHFSEQELAPNVLNEMTESLGDFIEIWIDRFLEQRRRESIAYSANLEKAIKTEHMTHGRMDTPSTKKGELDDFSDNFLQSEVLQMSKSLVAICFRQIPEPKRSALIKTDKLIGKMGRLEPELKTKRFGVFADGIQEWNKIKRVLGLPRLLPKEIGRPLQEYLDVGYDVKPEVDLESGKVFISLEHNASLRDLRKAFAWAALHFPESKRIVIRTEKTPLNFGERPSDKKTELVPIQECSKNTDQAYEEDLLRLAEKESFEPYDDSEHDVFLRRTA